MQIAERSGCQVRMFLALATGGRGFIMGQGAFFSWTSGAPSAQKRQRQIGEAREKNRYKAARGEAVNKGG